MAQNKDAGLNGSASGKRASHQEEKSVISYLHDIVCLVAGMMLVFSLLLRVVVVTGPSMNKTLYDGDWLLLLSNVFYKDPKPGDIIVAAKSDFEDGTPIIKRVIATEGQTVDIDFQEGVVYVDGTALDEPYTNTMTNLSEGVEFPLTVKENCIFVLGDNRNLSKDSRSTEIGQIDKRQVLGRALVLVVPGTSGGMVSRDFSRIRFFF